jgi:hypothetical protein
MGMFGQCAHRKMIFTFAQNVTQATDQNVRNFDLPVRKWFGGGMRKLFCLFGLFAISLSASAASEWLYYKHYPWVYDNVSKDWLYLRGAAGGEVYAYRSSTKEWEVFEVSEPTWEQKYEEWILNPEPYGGLSVLLQIKEAKESGATELDLGENNITTSQKAMLEEALPNTDFW